MSVHRPLLLIAALVAACSRPDGEEAGTAPSAPPVDSAPAAAPVDTAWRLSEGGIGPVRVGMTADEARAALGGEFELDEPLNGGPGACRYATSSAAPAGVAFMLEGLRIVRVEVDEPGPETTLGIRIGDSRSRVEQLYGNIRTEPHEYTAGQYLIAMVRAPADTLHRIVFETDSAGVVTRFRGGVYPPVGYVEGCA